MKARRAGIDERDDRGMLPLEFGREYTLLERGCSLFIVFKAASRCRLFQQTNGSCN